MNVAADVGRLELRALGEFEARLGGRPVDLGSRKQRALLAVLVVLAPRPVPVERLVDELWLEQPPGDPLRSLQVYVSALRRALGPEGGRLSTAARAYAMDVPDGSYDVDLFEESVRSIERHVELGQHDATVAAADRALAAWRGEAFQDLRGVPLLDVEATRLEEMRLVLETRRAEARLAGGHHGDAVAELEELVTRFPLHEELVGLLMLALHRSGRQADALATYAKARAGKREELGLEPGGPLRDLHALVLADDASLAVEDATLRGRRHLPAQVTRLIGRRSELEEIVALLGEPGSRLVTLTGPGGIGKTRLALQVAHELARDFPDGVWFVGLDDLTEPGLVPQAIASVLSVEAVGDDFVGPLATHLRSRRLLLLLDNFEQVVDAGPVLSELLTSGADCRILVTSRVRLQLYGERGWALEPLAPQDASALFGERARSVHRWFDSSVPAVAEAVEEVCAALDRLPLAVELVAARADEIDVTEMLGQLEARLELASRGPRDRSARQRTLRNAIGWSVDLLPPETASAFAHLGVFVGGFDPDAAEAVAGAGRAQLTALTEANLVQSDETVDRHRLLDTVREYALELAGVEVAALRQAHAAWFLGVVEAAVHGLGGESHRTRLAQLERERGNTRAALRHLADRGDHDSLLRLAGALGLFWFRTTPASEDVDWLDRAVESAPDVASPLLARALYALAICRAEQGHTDEAMAHGRRAYLMLRDSEDEAWKARALNTLAGLTRDLGRAAEAIPMLDESIAARRRLADPGTPVTLALTNRAMAALDLGDLPEARRCLAECLELAGTDQLERAMAHTGLADVAIEAGELREAADLLALSVPVLREADQRYRLIECLDTLAALAVGGGRPHEAAVLVAAADRALQEEQSVQVLADAELRARRIGVAVGELDEAQRNQATRTGEQLTLDAALDLATEWLL